MFDGVHRGHRHVLEELRAFADHERGEAVVITFDTHPRAVLAGAAPRPLLSLAHRLVLLERLGVDATVVLPFDAQVRDMTYERFAEDVLVNGLGIRGLLFGYNTNFGRDGAGTYETVRPLAARHGFAVREAPPITVDGSRAPSCWNRMIEPKSLVATLTPEQKTTFEQYAVGPRFAGGEGGKQGRGPGQGPGYGPGPGGGRGPGAGPG